MRRLSPPAALDQAAGCEEEAEEGAASQGRAAYVPHFEHAGNLRRGRRGGEKVRWRFRMHRSAGVARDRRFGDESSARKYRRRTLYANDSYVPYTAPTAPPTVAPSAAPVITLFAHLLSVNMSRLPNPRRRVSRCVRSFAPTGDRKTRAACQLGRRFGHFDLRFRQISGSLDAHFPARAPRESAPPPAGFHEA